MSKESYKLDYLNTRDQLIIAERDLAYLKMQCKFLLEEMDKSISDHDLGGYQNMLLDGIRKLIK